MFDEHEETVAEKLARIEALQSNIMGNFDDSTNATNRLKERAEASAEDALIVQNHFEEKNRRQRQLEGLAKARQRRSNKEVEQATAPAPRKRRVRAKAGKDAVVDE